MTQCVCDVICDA